jgi:hypothetical protein
MDQAPHRSVSVTIAAVVAIVSSAFLFLCCAFAFFAFLLLKLPGTSDEFPPFMKNVMLATEGFMICLCLFGIATGVGLIYLRNWARISILIWGGLSVFFGVIGIPIAYLSLSSPPPNVPNLPPESMQTVRSLLLLIYGLPLLVGVWWIVLFSRRSVKAQFAGTLVSADPSLPRKPACPTPIAVLAWFYVLSILNFVFLPFLPFRVPILVFGIVLPSAVGWPVLILSSSALAIAGIGLLKLKPWSYPLTIGLQLFWLASTVVSFLSPNYRAVMDSFSRDIQESLHLPQTAFSSADFSHHYGWTMILGFVFAGAILALLFYYRSRFLEAASRAASLS